jgi:hypothetical protein
MLIMNRPRNAGRYIFILGTKNYSVGRMKIKNPIEENKISDLDGRIKYIGRITKLINLSLHKIPLHTLWAENCI